VVTKKELDKNILKVTVGVNTELNPERTFDPSYVYASNQGIRAFAGVRHTLF
jgi:outer membrane receptor for ferrienterochelin and colicins